MAAPTKVRMGEVIRNARVFNPQNWRGGGVATDRLLQDVDRLFRLLAERQVEYVLVGGIALLQSRIERFRRGLGGAGQSGQPADQDQGNV